MEKKGDAQNKSYLGAPLTQEQMVRLKRLGITWKSRQESTWERAYQASLAYYEEYGNLNIPVSYTTRGGIRLGKWMRRQRDAYRSNSLSQERKKKLDTIGMVWEAASKGENRDNDRKY